MDVDYVTSEIRGEGVHKTRRLKRGGLIAITVVVALYISFNMFVFFILDYAAITDPEHNVAADFAIRVFRSNSISMASHAIYVSIALAAAGNIIGVTFSNARVNRDIAQSRLIPFYRFFGKSSNYGSTHARDSLGTPTGGLVLQALVTCITIASAQPFKTVLNLYTYGHAVVCFVLGVGVTRIRKRMNQYQTASADPARVGYAVPWNYQVMKRRRVRYTVTLFFIVVNVFLIVVPFIPSDNADGTRRETPSWVQPVIVTGIYLVGIVAALYILSFVRDLSFRKSEFRRGTSSDVNDFYNYNERRWIVRYPKWEMDWRSVFEPLPWKKIRVRLSQNGEAEAAETLRSQTPMPTYRTNSIPFT